jgi:hypothetical protein
MGGECKPSNFRLRRIVVVRAQDCTMMRTLSGRRDCPQFG